jgi:endo-alpha-1,4-polygalactosaminidase (GH114 family)
MEAVVTLFIGVLLGWLPTYVYHVKRRNQLEQSGARRTLRRIRDIVVAARGVDGKVQLAPTEAGEIIDAIEQTVRVDTVLRIPGA